MTPTTWSTLSSTTPTTWSTLSSSTPTTWSTLSSTTPNTLVRVLPLGTAYNIFIIYFKNLSNTTEVERSSCSKGQGWRGLWAGFFKFKRSVLRARSTNLLLVKIIEQPRTSSSTPSSACSSTSSGSCLKTSIFTCLS